MRARVESIKENEEKDNETEALMSNVLGQFSRIVELSPGLPPEIGQMAKTIQVMPENLRHSIFNHIRSINRNNAI